jgi:transcriptional regulator with XRE-family HTH domain
MTYRLAQLVIYIFMDVPILPQKDLAERLGVKQSTIAKWERDGAVYRKNTRKKLAAAFGVNEESFL